MATLTMLDVYLTNVWRLVFTSSREEGHWVPMEDPARFERIREMGREEGRSLQEDLTSAQAAIDTGQGPEQWKSTILTAL